MRTIEFFQTPAGRRPIEDFLDQLSGKQAQKVLWVLRLVEQLPIVPRQYFKKLEGQDVLWEVRVQSSGDTFRLLGFFHSGALIVLTNGFAKKSEKIPLPEIDLALRRRAEYLSRRA